MKQRTLRISAIVFVLVCGSALDSVAQSDLRARGQVRSYRIRQGSDPLAGAVRAGTPVVIRFRFDNTSGIVSYTSPYGARYTFDSADVNVTIGAFEFTATRFDLGIYNDLPSGTLFDDGEVLPGDGLYTLGTVEAVGLTGPCGTGSLGVSLNDETGAAFTTSSIPISLPPASLFQGRQLILTNSCFTLTASIDQTVPTTLTLSHPQFPIVLVHGLCSGPDTWESVVRLFADADLHYGGTISTSTLPPPDADVYAMDFFNKAITNGLQDWTNDLTLAIKNLNDSRTNHNLPVRPIVLIGHSAGGLAARAYAQNHPGSVHHLITYGTPHLGASEAPLGNLMELFCPGTLGSEGIKDMYVGSNFIRALNASESPLADSVLATSLVGDLAQAQCYPSLPPFRSDCVVGIDSQDLSKAIRLSPGQHARWLRPYAHVSTVFEFRDGETDDHTGLMLALNRDHEFGDYLVVSAHSPVSLEITDPNGAVLTRERHDIPFSGVTERVDAAGHEQEDYVIPVALPGQYLVRPIRKIDAASTDVYSITAERNGHVETVATGVPVVAIPNEPYRVTVLDQVAVPIWIRPGSQSPRVNMAAKGKLSVALLSTEMVDTSKDIDVASVTFGALGFERSLSKCSGREDVNSDGKLDLICHFEIPLLGLANDTNTLKLRGLTRAGQRIAGAEAVSVQ